MAKNDAPDAPRDWEHETALSKLHQALRNERLLGRAHEARARAAEHAVAQLPGQLATAVAGIRAELRGELAAMRAEIQDLAAALDQIRRA